MITTNVGTGGQFLCYSLKSCRSVVRSDIYRSPGIDPDLFFDDDGKAYVISSTLYFSRSISLRANHCRRAGKSGAVQADAIPKALISIKRMVSINLMAAEGGTEEAHSETIARSKKNIRGPYNPNPQILSSPIAMLPDREVPIQGLGHADMIEAHDGSWWIVFHGYRSIGGTII